MKFVDEIAEYIYRSPYEPEQFTIILPSNRMRKYLQRALARVYKQPIMSPEITTIDRWMKDVFLGTVIDRTSLLLELYKVHLRIEKDPVKASFEEFLTWGEMLLSDFNDIDRYLIDPKDIFRNLADIKEIEQWSFNDHELSEGQKRFMEFWDLLPRYYNELNKELIKKNIAYSGKGFRWLTENIDNLFGSDRDRHFVFAGFNALSTAEVSIIKQLVNMGRAVIFQDTDRYYMSRQHHEASTFIQRYQKDIPATNAQKNQLEHKEITIDLVSCVQHTGQVKVIAQELSELSPDELKETLLLLADESLITSVVKNLPATIGKANISMGIPLRATAIRTFVELIFSVQSNIQRFKTDAFYHSDLLKWMKHPYVQAIVDEAERSRITSFESRIIQKNQIFISLKGIISSQKEDRIKDTDVFFQLLKMIVRPWDNNWKLAVEQMKEISSFIFQRLGENDAFEKAGLEAFYRCLITFENLGMDELPKMGLKSFRHLFDRQWMTESIAYHGNPIDGLQIMGLLETRGIDFKRIYCIGLNEGKLPPTNPIQTLIPMDLRRYHGLPLPRDKQGIFAHHFYRLLHQCEHLLITYSSAESPMALYEPSRYVLQLEKELARDNKNVKIRKKTYTIENESQPTPFGVVKSPEVISRLDVLVQRSVSASLLRTFINCPLDFYYKYVLAFGESQGVEEELESATFGTLIHETLEELYRPFARLDKEGNVQHPTPVSLKVEDVDVMLKNFEHILLDRFSNHFDGMKAEHFLKGSNYLAFKMAKDMTERFLKNEKKFLMNNQEPLYIEALEYRMELETELDVAGETKKVKFVGFADRIDRVGKNYRIIDYKSGKVQDTDVTFMQKEEDISKSYLNRKFLIQLTQYVWMYEKLTGIKAQAGIYSFLDTDSRLKVLKASKLDLDELVKDFPNEIGLILADIYNTDEPFTHAQKYYSYCKYCN
ncbi:MAG: PD-(D/E)XK nuclease family protein [Bacteroidetes bacterium]|nr:MAG: PD-(D/E)XK nuclease family protein [Bacteroidota bacterium]